MKWFTGPTASGQPVSKPATRSAATSPGEFTCTMPIIFFRLLMAESEELVKIYKLTDVSCWQSLAVILCRNFYYFIFGSQRNVLSDVTIL